MKKKLMATVLAGVMAVSMLATGCGGSKDIKDGKIHTVQIHSVDVYFFCRAADPISSPVRSVIS